MSFIIIIIPIHGNNMIIKSSSPSGLYKSCLIKGTSGPVGPPHHNFHRQEYLHLNHSITSSEICSSLNLDFDFFPWLEGLLSGVDNYLGHLVFILQRLIPLTISNGTRLLKNIKLKHYQFSYFISHLWIFYVFTQYYITATVESV